MSRKRRTDADGRQIQERREGENMFVLQGEKPVCLLCSEASVVKENNDLPNTELRMPKIFCPSQL